MAVGLISVAACGSVGESGPQGQQALRVAYYIPESHVSVTGGIIPFSDDAAAKSGGGLKFEQYPSGQLGEAAQSLQILQQGIADIALVAVPYHSDVLPLSQGLMLPYGMSSRQLLDAGWRAMHEMPGLVEEWRSAGVVPLMLVPNVGYEFATTGTPVPDIASLAGQRMRVSSPLQRDVVAALGAAPVEMATPEMYEALERGTLDGTVFFPGAWPATGLDELLKHTTSGVELNIVPGVVAISRQAWDRLDSQSQQALYEAGRDASVRVWEATRDADAEVRERLERAGSLTVYEWLEAEMAALQERVRPVVDRWTEGAEQRGLPGRELIAQINEYKDEYGGQDPNGPLQDYEAAAL